jgi:hypothetical protein
MNAMRVLPEQLALVAIVFLLSAGAQQGETQWIPMCSKCLTPSISAKSGIGTAHAAAEGKVTLKDAQMWCASWDPDNKACPKEQLDNEKGAAYRISANCPAGKLTSDDGATYTVTAEVWNKDDVGAGQPKLRGPDGKIVGRDDASNGLGLAAQWQLLCPGKVKH